MPHTGAIRMETVNTELMDMDITGEVKGNFMYSTNDLDNPTELNEYRTMGGGDAGLLVLLDEPTAVHACVVLMMDR